MCLKQCPITAPDWTLADTLAWRPIAVWHRSLDLWAVVFHLPLSVLQPQLYPSFYHIFRASWLVHWLRVRLPVQGTRVQSLVQEDPTCLGAAEPRRCNKRSPHNEKPTHGLSTHDHSMIREGPHAATTAPCSQNKPVSLKICSSSCL